MRKGRVKIFFIFLMITFSLLWISDKYSVLIENEKYGYFETTEKSDTENQNENKLKTLYFDQVVVINLGQFSTINTPINSLYVFNIKEFSFESLTPPPELA